MKGLLGIGLLFLPPSVFGQTTGTVVLNVQGIRASKGGDLTYALFTEPNFPKTGRQSVGAAQPVTGAAMQVTLRDVPPGEYAVAVFQDYDRNRALNTNLVGYPAEPLGFSNDARIRFGPPAFTDARVRVAAGQTLTLPIKLR